MPSEPTVIRLKELDIHSIRPRTSDADETGSKIIVIGKPGSGKSVLMKNLIYHKRHLLPVGMVVSGTEDTNHFYESCFPPSMIHDRLTEDLLKNFSQRQKAAKRYIPDYAWALLVCDDCMDEPSMFRKTIVQDLFKNGRHWKMLFLLGMQYAMDIPPALRVCADGVFIFREPNLRNRKILYENYAGVIPDFKLFCLVMDRITDDYTALYIDNRTQSNQLEDCVFWYKATPAPDFQFGSEDYWNFYQERFDPDQEV